MDTIDTLRTFVRVVETGARTADVEVRAAARAAKHARADRSTQLPFDGAATETLAAVTAPVPEAERETVAPT